jgi:hypothetical protein
MVCRVKVCDNKKYIKGYCTKHYLQIYRYGKIISTIYDKNVINIKGDVCELICLNKDQIESGRAIFDLKYYNLVKKHKWHIRKSPTGQYVGKTLKDKSVLFLHQLILKPKKGLITDHINHNTLDNRFKNLRRVSNTINARNSLIRKNTSSGCVGVSWDKSRNKFGVSIRANNKLIHLGRFKCFEDAVLVRRKAEQRFWGKVINRIIGDKLDEES